MKLAQIDTFYNGLNDNDQDSLNAATDGNLLSKTTREALQIIKNKSKVCYSRNKLNVSRINLTSKENASKTDDRIDKLVDQISTLLDIFSKKVVVPASVKAVEESCVTCGGPHAHYNCDATNSKQPSVCVAMGTYSQGQGNNRGNNFHGNQPFQVSNQGFQNQPFQVPNNPVQQGFSNEFSSYKKVNDQMMRNMQNQINSLKGEFKNEIQNTMKTQQTVLMEQRTAFQNNLQNMLSGFFQNQSSTSGTLSSNIIPNPKGEMKEITTRSGVAYEGPLIPTPKKDKLFELAKIPLNENCSVMLLKKLPENIGDPVKFLIPCDFPRMDVCHALADLDASINLMPLSIWKKLSLRELTPTQITLEVADRSITRPKGVAEDVFFKVGKFHFPTDFVVVDFKADSRTTRYSSTYYDMSVNRIDVIDVAREEYAQEMLGFFNNSSGGNPTSISEPIISDSSPFLTPFERSDFILEEIEAYLKDESILSETDHANCDSEGDIRLIEKLLNDDPFQLLPMDLKHREVVKAKSLIKEPPDLELKDFPSHLEYAYLEGADKLPVIIAKDLKDDEKEALLKVLKSHKQAIAWKITDIKGEDKLQVIIEKDLKVDEKEALLKVLKSHKRAIAWKIIDIKGIDPRFCTHKILMVEDYKPVSVGKPYSLCTSERRMPFGLCNAPRTFQRCIMAIFHDMIEKTMEVFVDDFLVFGDLFSSCLSHLDTTLQRCEDTNLVLNWEKSHFMVKEGIVTGHKIYKNGLEVDRAKVNVIAKLPHPMTVKGVRSFLGHVGFYRRFIQDFSNIARPMTHLLEKETPDFAVGTVLGQHKMKHFQPIHYASKTITEAQIHYTTTEKEILSVVYAFEKFRPYLVLSKSIVYTDHSALKYLLSKQDAMRYILVAVDYLSKWVEVKALPTNDARVRVKFLKSLFAQFETPRAITSDRGTYFCNDKFAKVMSKYGVTHRLANAYHPQTSGQVEVLNRGLKRILERTVGENRASWSEKLEDALWAFRTAYKIPIGFDLKTMGDHQKLQLNELNELHDQAYENYLIYKEKTKKLHDSKIKNRIFNVGDRVLLFNSRLKILSGKLKTRWSGPFTITNVFPYGTVELSQPDGPNFKMNGHRVKHYFGGDVPQLVVPDLQTFLMDKIDPKFLKTLVFSVLSRSTRAS
nr:reverse transcriptase domain-containing protein [Tanacetum cinerariifolium]